VSLELWYLLLFATGAGLAVPLCLIAERIGNTVGLIDRPRPGEALRHVVPRTGGYALFAALWLTIGASYLVYPPDLERLPADNLRLIGVLCGSAALIPLAVVDDWRRLGPFPQLFWQIAAAAVPTFFGLRMEEVATPGGPMPVPEALRVPLAVFWIVAMINAINLIDSLDGLAGGITGIASWVLFVRTTWFGQASIAVLPLVLCGVCAGFLTRNWHPSRVILGSSGALLLGYLLGVITLIGGVKIGTAFLVLAVPILDVAWVSYRRLRQRRSPFKGGDARHLAHRLRELGLSDARIVLSVYTVCAGIGAAVLSMHSLRPTPEKPILIGFVALAVLAALAAVTRVSSRDSEG
jgi:UDP-GlcNAc:undecaprenyl-phosphate GlcNAc-1-phosphate transferase